MSAKLPVRRQRYLAGSGPAGYGFGLPISGNSIHFKIGRLIVSNALIASILNRRMEAAFV
jgi:hypothetical protein